MVPGSARHRWVVYGSGMRRRAVAGTLLAQLILLSGCSGSTDTPAAKTPAPTPITKLDVAGVRLARVPFCDRLTETAVRRALGGAAESDDAWANGDPVPGGSGSGDVGHELGCSWSGPGGAEAAAWVFARPVSADFATTLVRRATRDSCPAQPAGVFGSPALLQLCPASPGLERVRRAGLFGDGWLTCEVTGPTADARARADRWCATVVSALDVS
jgi:hypothetical protein